MRSLETMSTQLGTSFKVFELVDEVRQDATRLEAKVQERTRELREAQRRLVEAAHQAGMAEVAVGALHDVGNLLNSVSVCAEQLADLARSAHVDGLARAKELSRTAARASLPRLAGGGGGTTSRSQDEAPSPAE